MSRMLRGACVSVVILLVVVGLVRAQTSRFQQKSNAIVAACKQELQKLGITRDAAKEKYSTPEIGLTRSGRCLVPGQMGEVVVSGRFAPGTHFLLENDNIDVVKESQTGSEYRATVKVAAGIGPQTASLSASSAATCISARGDNTVIIVARTEWTIDAANGWRIVARPAGEVKCEEEGFDGFPYDVSFFRKGESAAFRKLNGTLNYSVDDGNYHFGLSEAAPTGNAGEDMMSLSQKLSDPKLTDAQRDAIMAKLQKQAGQMESMAASMASAQNVAAREQDRQEFGCEAITATMQAGGRFTGDMKCSDQLGHIALTGTMKILPR